MHSLSLSAPDRSCLHSLSGSISVSCSCACASVFVAATSHCRALSAFLMTMRLGQILHGAGRNIPSATKSTETRGIVTSLFILHASLRTALSSQCESELPGQAIACNASLSSKIVQGNHPTQRTNLAQHDPDQQCLNDPSHSL